MHLTLTQESRGRRLKGTVNHRRLVPENGGYSAKLIGWVEVGGQEGGR